MDPTFLQQELLTNLTSFSLEPTVYVSGGSDLLCTIFERVLEKPIRLTPNYVFSFVFPLCFTPEPAWSLLENCLLGGPLSLDGRIRAEASTCLHPLSYLENAGLLSSEGRWVMKAREPYDQEYIFLKKKTVPCDMHPWLRTSELGTVSFRNQCHEELEFII